MQLIYGNIDAGLTFAIFALALNLLQGYTGQVSLAQAAFGGIGGYALGYIVLNMGGTAIESVAAGTIGAGLVGVLIGYPALRLTTEWLILLTLATQTIIISLIVATNALGGAHGLLNVVGLSIFGRQLENPSDFFLPFLVCTIVVFLICYRMGESPYGRVLRSIREDEIACRALGKGIFGYKLTVFGITSAMAGLAGALLVIDNQGASPTQFSFAVSSAIVAIVVIGGSGNLWGTLVGVLAVSATQPILEHVLNFSPEVAAIWRQVIYGALLVQVVMTNPAGIVPDSTAGRVRGLIKRIGGGRALELAAAGGPILATAGAGASGGIGGVTSKAASSNGSANGVHSIAAVHLDAAAQIPDVSPDSTTARAPRVDAVLEVRGLTKHFGGIRAVEDLDITLHRGTITALVGPNGAGKSTVFNLVTGAIAPDTGDIRLYGKSIAGLKPDQIARLGMARSFQDVRVFPKLSSIENVMLASQHNPGEHFGALFTQFGRVSRAEKETAEKAYDWLKFVGMQDFAAAPAGSLAFGQQKLVALARVLATEAEVLLLDEPASGIDQQWIDVMLDLIKQVKAQGRSVCIVEHNLNVVERLADHTYFMELGRITAQGDFAELTSDKRLAEAYFGTS